MNCPSESFMAAANALTWPGAFAVVGVALAAAVVACMFLYAMTR